jgi:hypothetical protein
MPARGNTGDSLVWFVEVRTAWHGSYKMELVYFSDGQPI